MTTQTVAVCVPVYNARATIGDTIVSLLRQTYQPMRVFVFDNRSTDGTPEFLEREFGDDIALVRSQVHSPWGEDNFNRCLTVGWGDYIAIYHGDDVYHPQIVAKEASVLSQNPDVSMVFAAATPVDAELRDRPPSAFGRFFRARSAPIVFLDGPDAFVEVVRWGNFFVCPTAMSRRTQWTDEIGGWRKEKFGTGSDLDVWLRAARLGTLAIVNERLIHYRETATQGTVLYHQGRTERADFLRVLAHYADLPEFQRRLGHSDRIILELREVADALFVLKNLARGRDLRASAAQTRRVAAHAGRALRYPLYLPKAVSHLRRARSEDLR